MLDGPWPEVYGPAGPVSAGCPGKPAVSACMLGSPPAASAALCHTHSPGLTLPTAESAFAPAEKTHMCSEDTHR